MAPTLPMKIAGGPFLMPPKADMEPVEEQPFDFSSKYNEGPEEPERKSRTESSSYQDDDMPRVYCTEGTPRLISRASSVGDLTGVDKRRPETIHEHDEVKLASHTATANATPRMWSRNSSPTSVSSFCMNGAGQFDAHSIVSEFSRQPSGLISPSDLPDSPGQTMPSSPKDRRSYQPIEPQKPIPYEYAYDRKYAPDYGQPQLPEASRFTPIVLADEVKKQADAPPLVRPNPEPRLRSFTVESKSMIGDQYIQEDSLHNYRTEDTPANLSAATSFSDLSIICPKSDYHGPVPRPRRRKPISPLSGTSPLPPLKTSHVSDLYSPVQDEGMLPFDQKSEQSSFSWKPRTLPRKVAQKSTAAVVPASSGPSQNCRNNKSMSDLNKEADHNDSDVDDDELLREVISKGRPNRNKNNVAPKKTKKIEDSESDMDQQEILDELIKLGRPTSRMAVLNDVCSKKDKFKSARSMENLNPSKVVVKKGSTNFRVREQPLRGAEGAIPKVLTRAQSLKGTSKSLGYDPIQDRRHAKTPDPVQDRRLAKTPDPSQDRRNLSETNQDRRQADHFDYGKPVSKVSPMRSARHDDEDEDFEKYVNPKQVLLSPLRSSVRQSRQTSVKKTPEMTGKDSDSASFELPPSPPIPPPKPPQFRKPPAVEPVEQQESLPSQPQQQQQQQQQPTSSNSINTNHIINSEENNNNSTGEQPKPAEDFPAEPPEDCGDVTVLSFKFTDSQKSYTRRFLASSQFYSVLNYLASKGFPSDKYKVVVPTVLRINKKQITDNCYGKTLAELKMVPKKTLTVKPR